MTLMIMTNLQVTLILIVFASSAFIYEHGDTIELDNGMTGIEITTVTQDAIDGPVPRALPGLRLQTLKFATHYSSSFYDSK